MVVEMILRKVGHDRYFNRHRIKFVLLKGVARDLQDNVVDFRLLSLSEELLHARRRSNGRIKII
ncbi:hypothetical protein D3C87_1359500 [compost metagenome]